MPQYEKQDRCYGAAGIPSITSSTHDRSNRMPRYEQQDVLDRTAESQRDALIQEAGPLAPVGAAETLVEAAGPRYEQLDPQWEQWNPQYE